MKSFENDLQSNQNSASSLNRREFLQSSLAAAAIASVPSLARADAPKPKRPNLIFLLGEGQRSDALSIAGHPFLKTPNHDRIGAEGLRFENAFCTNALCAPARATALTGLYSRTSGALSNKLPKVPLGADIPLFTDLLHEAGYDVALVGKTHLRNGAEERYWDYYFGHNAASNDYVNPLFKEGRKGKIGEEVQYKDVWPDDLATDRALAWLDEERGERPFCLLLWWVAPHEPFFRPRRKFDSFNDGTRIRKPGSFDDDLKGWPGKPASFVAATNKIGTTMSHLAASSLEGMAKDYYAGLEGLDDNVGRLFQYLEKKNILDDTAILHSSDHGYFLGEWRLFDKRLMHEPSIRVPLMIRYPKRVQAGTLRTEQVLDVDLAPTFLDLAGIPAPKHMEGKSILSLAQKPDPEFRKEWFYEYFEWPNPEGVRPHHGIRTESHKLIQYTMNEDEHEMYDLRADPHETINLYDHPAHAQVREQLTRRMNELSSQIPTRKGADVG